MSRETLVKLIDHDVRQISERISRMRTQGAKKSLRARPRLFIEWLRLRIELAKLKWLRAELGPIGLNSERVAREVARIEPARRG